MIDMAGDFVSPELRQRAADDVRTMSIEMSLSEWRLIMGALILAESHYLNKEYLGIRDVILNNYKAITGAQGG